jgi:hypothetical protein
MAKSYLDRSQNKAMPMKAFKFNLTVTKELRWRRILVRILARAEPRSLLPTLHLPPRKR